MPGPHICRGLTLGDHAGLGRCTLTKTMDRSWSLDKAQRAVVQSSASAWHVGWTPNREDVENLTDRARGSIDRADYRRRAHAAARRQTAATA